MSKMFEYKGTVEHQNDFGREISKFMNHSDFSGEWGVVTHKISFKSAVDRPLLEFEQHIKDCYEKAGGTVFEVKLWKRQIDNAELKAQLKLKER